MKDSKFKLWRATFSLVHLDHKVTKEELNWIEGKLKTLSLESDQHAQLVRDFKEKKSIKELYQDIKIKADQAFLLHQVRVISHLDNDYSEEEKAYFDKLEKLIMKNINLDQIKSELGVVSKAIANAEKYQYLEDDEGNDNSFFTKLYVGFRKLYDDDDE